MPVAKKSRASGYRFNMHMSAQERDAIRKAAKRAGMNMSTWVRMTLRKAWSR